MSQIDLLKALKMLCMAMGLYVYKSYANKNFGTRQQQLKRKSEAERRRQKKGQQYH